GNFNGVVAKRCEECITDFVVVFNKSSGDVEDDERKGQLFPLRDNALNVIFSWPALIELLRLAAWNAECFPVTSFKVFGQKQYLSGMMRVMRDLPIDCLHHRVRLATHCNGLVDILGLQRLDRVEHDLPTVFPITHDVSTTGGGVDDEFLIAVACRLLAVSRQKVGEARMHVSRHVLHENCN